MVDATDEGTDMSTSGNASRSDLYTASDVAVVRPTALATPAYDLFSDTRMQLVRDSLAKGAPDDVFVAMVEIARTRGLDPLAKQIGVIKFGDTWQVMTTIDGYRALAEKTGQYAGSDEAVFTHSDQTVGPKKVSRPDTASVTVWKLIGGQRYPFTATVYWEEYAAFNVWLSKPRTMLAKVAESHALRKAFPSVLSGMHVDGEMDQLAIETSGAVDGSQIAGLAARPETARAPVRAQDDVQRALAALHAEAADLGMDHDDIKRFATERSGKDAGSMRDWNVRQIAWTKAQLAEHGRDWIRSQTDATTVVEATVTEIVDRPLVDSETGEIIPESADDIDFPFVPAGLLPSEDPQPVRRNPDEFTY